MEARAHDDGRAILVTLLIVGGPVKYVLDVRVVGRDDPVATQVYGSVHAALDAVARLYTRTPPVTTIQAVEGSTHTFALSAPRPYEITLTPYQPSTRRLLHGRLP